MKTIKDFLEALRVEPIYAEDFSNREDVFREFAKADEADIQICYANYYPGDYCGDGTVFYFRESTGKYYEVYGSHCSCHGLEGQWESDEEVNEVELLNRFDKGYMYDGGMFKRLWEQFLNN